MLKKPTKGRVDHIDQLVSKNLTRRRTLLGVTRKELAKTSGVTIQQIQKYEKGTNRLSGSKLFNFAKLLEVPISYFFNNNLENSNAEENTLNESINNKEYSLSETEVNSLIKVFRNVKNIHTRKKIIEIVKTMA